MELNIKNKFEKQCYKQLQHEGWFVVKKGWPDFCCIKEIEGKLIMVEVKPKRSHRLKKTQYIIMSALTKAGITCYRWTPEGFELFSDQIPHLE